MRRVRVVVPGPLSDGHCSHTCCYWPQLWTCYSVTTTDRVCCYAVVCMSVGFVNFGGVRGILSKAGGLDFTFSVDIEPSGCDSVFEVPQVPSYCRKGL